MDDLRSLLACATSEQLQALVEILDTNHCTSSSPAEIAQGVQWLHRNIFETFHHEITGESETYADVLCTLLKRLNIAATPQDGCAVLEEALVRKTFEPMWQKLSDGQRLNFCNAVEHNIERLGKGKELLHVGGLVGVLAAANAGGIGTYLLASSALHGVAGSIGITLPFGLYKAVSSAMSIALGPIGIIGISIFALYKLTGTNYTKLIPAAMYIALLRYELEARPNKVLGRQVIPHDYASKRGTRLF